MGSTHYEVAVHFAKRSSDKNKRAHNVYTGRENTYIYSYGEHFVMAYADDERKLVVVNGDRYSSTTSSHQSDLRSALSSYLPAGYRQITVPFSVLRQADVDFQTVEPVDVAEDWEKAYCDTHSENFYSDDFGPTAYQKLSDHRQKNNWECKTHYEHRLGGSVFRAYDRYSGRRSKRKYFLSGFDETHNRRTDGYFVSLLPHPVKTVQAAFESLAPLPVRKAIAAGIEVKRQGDCFAIPEPDLKITNRRKGAIIMKAHMEPIYQNKYIRDGDNWYDGHNEYIDTGRKTLEIPTFNSGSHGANEVAILGTKIYARGNLIHRPVGREPEHKRIPLGKIWHRIYKNTAIRSWQSLTGRVD